MTENQAKCKITYIFNTMLGKRNKLRDGCGYMFMSAVGCCEGERETVILTENQAKCKITYIFNTMLGKRNKLRDGCGYMFMSAVFDKRNGRLYYET